jgi:CheY-like chemotaxis protein
VAGNVQPRKILIVDDSRLMVKMYEMMLRAYPTVPALDGIEALERLDEHDDIDAMILDINMPNMSGLEVLSRLREDGRLDRLTVIIVTTDGHEDEIRRGLEAGAAAYLTKPFDADRLLSTIAGTRKEPAS